MKPDLGDLHRVDRREALLERRDLEPLVGAEEPGRRHRRPARPASIAIERRTGVSGEVVRGNLEAGGHRRRDVARALRASGVRVVDDERLLAFEAGGQQKVLAPAAAGRG